MNDVSITPCHHFQINNYHTLKGPIQAKHCFSISVHCMLQKQKQNVNEDHMLCSFFLGGGAALELWLSLITQQRDDGQEVNISNFRSLGTRFIKVLSYCYSIENFFPLCLFWTHNCTCKNRYLRKDTFEQRTTQWLEMRPLSF